ncbi:MAG: hypothetical protein GC151_04435 [Betaproteobacteria bacterium]|nr:hypothetical protein [Betaproteobacteria bacterium]
MPDRAGPGRVPTRAIADVRATPSGSSPATPGTEAALNASRRVVTQAARYVSRFGVVAQRAPLSGEEYEQVKAIALQIMRRYPPGRYHYLGLGKSPTPVMAFLQEFASRASLDLDASSMPLSKFGHRTGSMTGAERRVVDGPELDAEQRERLWEHFDAFVPSPGSLEGKDIVLIDLVQTGKSLVATQRHLEEYLNERYLGTGATGLFFSALAATGCLPSPPRVEALPLAIQEQQVEGTRKVMDSLGLSDRALMIPGSLDDPGSLAAGMGGEKYKPRAEYPADFKISAPERPRTGDIRRDPEGEYDALRREFAAFMQRDAPIVELMRGDRSVERLQDRVSDTEQLLSRHDE